LKIQCPSHVSQVTDQGTIWQWATLLSCDVDKDCWWTNVMWLQNLLQSSQLYELWRRGILRDAKNFDEEQIRANTTWLCTCSDILVYLELLQLKRLKLWSRICSSEYTL
jgi:hypothetical protein